MNTVLDEVTGDAIDAKHVERHVKNWEERLNGLYAMIGDWLPDGWKACRGSTGAHAREDEAQVRRRCGADTRA